MGKKLIIKGADFHANAIDGTRQRGKFLVYDNHSVFTPSIALVSGDKIVTKFVLFDYGASSAPYIGIVSGAQGDDVNNVGIRIMNPSNNKNIVFDCTGVKRIFPFTWEVNTLYEVEVGVNSVVVNGVTYTTPSDTRTWGGSQVFAIGAAIIGGNIPYDGLNGKLYSVKIYDSNNELKHNFEPVQNNQIVDTVTGITYNNASGGNALYGED